MHEAVLASPTLTDGLLERALGARSLRSEFDTRQPTTRRENTSMTKAT